MENREGAANDFWDVLIEKYQKHSRHPFTELFAQDMLEGLELDGHSRVLDVASGVGSVALAAAERGARVVAIDSSPGLVRRLAQRAPANLSVRLMDGQALQLETGSFDAALSLFGVVFFPDWRLGLAEMARVTRPGGWGVVGVWLSQDGAASSLLLNQIRRKLFPELPPLPLSQNALHLSDPERLAQALRQAGYAEPALREVTHPFRFDLGIVGELDRYLDMLPAWNTLDSGQKEEVAGEITRLAREGGHAEYLPVPSTALIAAARRL